MAELIFVNVMCFPNKVFLAILLIQISFVLHYDHAYTIDIEYINIIILIVSKDIRVYHQFAQR